MKKNIYLTKSEQEIFNLISKVDIITNEQIKDLFLDLDPKKINKICSNLRKKGYLHRIKKGIYLIQKGLEDPFTLAFMLYKGYIGFSSALKIYNLIEYEPFTIFIVTKNKSCKRKIGQYTFRYVSMGEKAIGMTLFNSWYVSNLEKTFFDCFYKPHYAGGYSEVTKALYLKKEIDWNMFLYFFKRFATNSLCQRTGYVLDLLENETGLIPPEVIEYFKKRIKTRTKLVPTLRTKGKFIKEWNIVDNIGKENILSWW